MTPRHTSTYRIADSTYTAVSLAATALDLSVNDVVNDALELWLQKPEVGKALRTQMERHRKVMRQYGK